LQLTLGGAQAVELLKQIGAYAMALDIINQRLSDAISAMVSGRLDGETKITGLVLNGNEVLEAQKTGSSRFERTLWLYLVQ
jgi:nuclear pore complex protein Nup93